MLVATAGLAPAARAALALAYLVEEDPSASVEALGLGREGAERLLSHAHAQLAQRLQLEVGAAEQAYRRWLWAEPPHELWEGVFANHYRQLEAELPQASEATTAVSRAPARRRLQRKLRWPGRWPIPAPWRLAWRPRWWIVLLGAILGCSGAYAAAVQLGVAPGLGPHRHAPTLPPLPPSAVTPPGSPSVADLNRLRTQQQQSTRDYLQRKQQAAAAQRNQAHAAALAQQRARADQLRRQRDAKKRRPGHATAPAPSATPVQPAPTAPAPTTATPPIPPIPTTSQPASPGAKHKGKRKHKKRHPNAAPSPGASSPAPTPQNKQQANQSCLYNPDNGTYVCPQ